MTDYDIHSCGYYCDKPACIKAQRDQLRDKLYEIYEVWAGSEGIPIPETAAEAYLVRLVEQMRDIAKNGAQQPEETMKTELMKEPNCYGDGNVYRGLRSRDSEAKTIYTESRKEWVGLTDEEILAAGLSAGFKAGSVRFNLIVQSIEAKLKEKNNV
jgi:hypothetical protein